MIFLNTALAASPRYRQTEEPPVSTYDVDFQAKIDFADANGVTKPSTTQLDIENQRVVDYKATGGWAKDDCYFDFTGETDTHIQWRLIDTKRRVQAVTYGSLTWDANGVTGNGTNGYIDPLFNPALDGVNYTLNDAGLMFFANTLSISTSFFGAYSGSLSDYVLYSPQRITDKGYFFLNGGAEATFIGDSVGLNALYRIGSNLKIHSGDNTGTFVKAPEAVPNMKIYFLARNNQGTADVFNPNSVKYMTIGASKDAEHAAIKSVLI